MKKKNDKVSHIYIVFNIPPPPFFFAKTQII